MPSANAVGADNAVTLCDLRILVDQAAEPVASADADVVVGRGDAGPAVGWSLAECPVRPVGVVVIDVFAEDAVEMSPAGDEDAVGALAPRAGDPPLADRVRRGAWTGVLVIRMSTAVKTASNAPVYLASRSLIRNFRPSVRSPKSMSAFRACCTVQAAVGWSVTPARWTRRWWCSMTNRTKSRRRKTVPAWKKSTAAIVFAWADRNCFQLAAARRGVDAGGLEDVPDGEGRDLVPETRQLAADPPVAPGRVVAGHLQHERRIAGPVRGRPGPWRKRPAQRVVPATTRGTGAEESGHTTSTAHLASPRCCLFTSAADSPERSRSGLDLGERQTCNSTWIVQRMPMCEPARCATWRTFQGAGRGAVPAQ